MSSFEMETGRAADVAAALPVLAVLTAFFAAGVFVGVDVAGAAGAGGVSAADVGLALAGCGFGCVCATLTAGGTIRGSAALAGMAGEAGAGCCCCGAGADADFSVEPAPAAGAALCAMRFGDLPAPVAFAGVAFFADSDFFAIHQIGLKIPRPVAAGTLKPRMISR